VFGAFGLSGQMSGLFSRAEIPHFNSPMELLFHGPIDGINGRSTMDTTRCSHCKKRMKAVIAENGRTEFRCLDCDLVDPIKTDAVKWAQSPLAAPAAD
jgi:hypothetical protein